MSNGGALPAAYTRFRAAGPSVGPLVQLDVHLAPRFIQENLPR